MEDSFINPFIEQIELWDWEREIKTQGNPASLIMVFLLLGSALVLAFNVQPANAAGIDWWPMFRHDTNHTGTSMSAGPTTNNTLWTYTTDSYVDSSPAVVGGFVYIGAVDNRTYCLNAATGTQVWNYTTGGNVHLSSAAVVGGLVYVGSMDGKVYCLNAATGTQVWNYTTGDIVFSSPTVVGDLIYVSSGDGKVYCLNATSGAFVWNHQLVGYLESSPAVAGGLVYVGSTDGNFYCLNAATGAYVWNYSTGGPVESSPAVVGGLVYVGSDNSNVYCLNATNGAHVWNFATGGYVQSSPAVVGGLVYVGSWDGYIDCLNASNGAFVWFYRTGSSVVSSPAVAGGLVYVGSTDGNFYCLNAADGAFVWSYTTGSYEVSSPAVVNGVVYLGSEDGKIYAFSGVAVSVGLNVTVSPTNSLELTFPNVTAAGIATAVGVPTVQAPVLNNTVGLYYDVKVTASYSGNVTVSLAFDGSNMTQQQKGNLTMVQYTPIPGDIQPVFGQVDMRDIGYIARRFGTNSSSPLWDPNADLNSDGKIDMRDIGLVARNFGRTSQWINITTYVDTANNIIYGNTTHFSFISIH